MQGSLRQTAALARRVLRHPERQIAMRRFDRFHGHFHGQHEFNVIFGKEECHVWSPLNDGDILACQHALLKPATDDNDQHGTDQTCHLG